MDSRKGLKPGDPRLIEAERVLEAMRSKSKRAREMHGHRMTKRGVTLQNAKVDLVVADDSHVAMQAVLAKTKALFVNRLDSLSEDLTWHHAVSQRAGQAGIQAAECDA